VTAGAETIPLAVAVPGQVLAADVVSAQGDVLLPRGMALTGAHLESLQRRGIGEIRIVAAVAADAEAERRERLRRVGRLFRRAGDDPLMRELEQILVEFHRELPP